MQTLIGPRSNLVPEGGQLKLLPPLVSMIFQTPWSDIPNIPYHNPKDSQRNRAPFYKPLCCLLELPRHLSRLKTSQTRYSNAEGQQTNRIDSNSYVLEPKVPPQNRTATRQSRLAPAVRSSAREKKAYDRFRGVAGRSGRQSEAPPPALARSNRARLGEPKGARRARAPSGEGGAAAPERGEGDGIHSSGGFRSREARGKMKEESVVAVAGDGSRHGLLSRKASSTPEKSAAP